MVSRLVLVVTVSGVLLGRIVAAGPLETYTPPTAPPPMDPIGILFRMVGLTLVTLFLCGATIYAIRRYGPNRITAPNTAGRFIHEGTLVISGRTIVHSIRVDGQRVIATIDAGGLRTMTLVSETFETVLANEVLPASTVINTSITE